MSAQMLSSGTPTSEPVPIPAINEMQMLEAKAAAASIGGEVKQNISFVRGETQSKAVEESEAQQVITIILSLKYFVFLTTELQWKMINEETYILITWSTFSNCQSSKLHLLDIDIRFGY